VCLCGVRHRKRVIYNRAGRRFLAATADVLQATSSLLVDWQVGGCPLEVALDGADDSADRFCLRVNPA